MGLLTLCKSFDMQSVFRYISYPCLLLLFFNLACKPSQISLSQLKKEYDKAVIRSQNPIPNDIYTNLTAINDLNTKLDRDSLGRIKVVTWTSWTGYQQKLQDTMRLTRKIWVTVAPQMQDACSSLKRSYNKTMRIRQWLGMPPDTDYTHFVEMYVYPDNLFRPCPDPEISDRECELDFPDGLYKVTDSEYADVYQNLKTSTNGYPFTGLGYTYDWGNAESKVGFSEFIVNDLSVVYISSFTPTETYCR